MVLKVFDGKRRILVSLETNVCDRAQHSLVIPAKAGIQLLLLVLALQQQMGPGFRRDDVDKLCPFPTHAPAAHP